ncbi:hypothetical protein [Knoellia subterranea]|uniref:hypothetical protein n=1 Tax=Knoellia subterranea TaxID=184882 RepID=UPI0012ECA4B8|nr:hypothetical protein [Knoellia subterranea]
MRTHPYNSSGRLVLKRQVFATSALAALGQRGIDLDSLVRHGFGDRVKVGLASFLTYQDRSPDERADSWPHYLRWRRIFGESENNASEVGGYFRSAIQGEAQRYIDSWLESAPLEDLIAWRPTFDEIRPVKRDEEAVETWQWFVDRFTQTYLASWAPSSLRREYLIVSGQVDSPIETQILRERPVHVDRVARAIAESTISVESGTDPSITAALTEQALELLHGGDRTAAAALFEAARTFSPKDPTLKNNYAFCIILDKPTQAVPLLEESLSGRVVDSTVVLCNLMLAHHLIGDNERALEFADIAFDSVGERTLGAYLWRLRREPSDWFVDHVMPADWIVELGARIESSNGGAGIWTSRQDPLQATAELSEDL